MTTDQKTKKLSFFETIYRSFYARALYQNVAFAWKGLGLPYLLFLLMIYWVPEMMNIHRSVSEFIADKAPEYIEQIPVITITHGEASIEEPVPYIIVDRKTNAPVAIIDTSGKTASPGDTPVSVLLTKNHIFVRSDETTMRSFPLSDFGDLTVTRKLIYGWLDVINNLLVVVLFPLVLLLSFASHILQAGLLSLLGGFFAKYFNVALSHQALFRLSVVAFTPPVMLETVHAVLDIQYPYSAVVSFLIAGGYLFYAVGCCSDKPPSGIARNI